MSEPDEPVLGRLVRLGPSRLIARESVRGEYALYVHTPGIWNMIIFCFSPFLPSLNRKRVESLTSRLRKTMSVLSSSLKHRVSTTRSEVCLSWMLPECANQVEDFAVMVP